MPVTTLAPTVPAVSDVATTQQVADHSTAVKSVISALESAPQSVDNAEAYLNAQAEATTSWVSAKHMRTRLIEVSAIVAAVSGAIGFIIGHLF